MRAMAHEDGTFSPWGFEGTEGDCDWSSRFQYRALGVVHGVCFGKVHQDCISKQ
jgi:hypothetical protein